jgi:hypothetical protein
MKVLCRLGGEGRTSASNQLDVIDQSHRLLESYFPTLDTLHTAYSVSERDQISLGSLGDIFPTFMTSYRSWRVVHFARGTCKRVDLEYLSLMHSTLINNSTPTWLSSPGGLCMLIYVVSYGKYSTHWVAIVYYTCSDSVINCMLLSVEWSVVVLCGYGMQSISPTKAVGTFLAWQGCHSF